jgi:hypothetical protein
MIALVPLQPLFAQGDCDEECKVNTNVAMVVNVTVGSTAQVAGIGWGAVAGIGYNFNQHHSVIGEFMQPLQTASQSSNLSGNNLKLLL